MRKITKIEPPALSHYRALPDAKYDGPGFTPVVKNTVKQALLHEQGYLCAYCMQRISADKMKLEHWQCQNSNSDRQLDYDNMLGCCMGNEGKPRNQQTCDTHKADLDLKYSPAIDSHTIESQIRYLGDGRISSKDKEFDDQLNWVLNLNLPRLVSNRKVLLLEIQATLSKKSGRRTKSELTKLIDQATTPDHQGKLREYVGVFVADLNKRHRKAS